MTTNQPIQHGDDHRRVTVTRHSTGWVVREEYESRIVRQTTYRDWHRVERALHVFDLQRADPAHSTNL
jgi:hypothetical protein